VILELAQIAGGWPLAASLAAAVTVEGLRVGRRRTALNEALHELRRPLQALALASPAVPSESEGPLQMVTSALDRLDREINGAEAAAPRAPILARTLVGSAVGRWKGRAALVGGSLELRWRAGGAVLSGNRCEVAQALDNLIVNAIEHGGPAIVVEGSAAGDRLCVSVTDSGRGARPDSRRESPAELIARLSGRRRHGHGLRVVRRTAAAHGGSFRLRSSERGTEAVLDLPLQVAAEGAR
jgi:signal transduction histidine kinase